MSVDTFLLSIYDFDMSFHDHRSKEASFTPTSRSLPAPALLAYSGAGPFQLKDLALFQRQTGPTRYQEHRHDVYHLVIFTQGRNAFLLKGRNTPSSRGLCVFCAPNEAHCFNPRKPGMTEYHAVTFSYPDLKNPPAWSDLITHYTGLAVGAVPALTHLPEDAFLQMAPILSTLRQALPALTAVSSLQLHLGILQLMAIVADVLRKQEEGRLGHDDSVPETLARQYLDAHFADGSTLADVAAEAGVSTAHLGRIFKRAFGVSPGRYRDGLRMEAACNLLRHSGLLVKEIAGRLGYPDAATFSKAFQRQLHASPAAFRGHKTAS